MPHRLGLRAALTAGTMSLTMLAVCGCPAAPGADSASAASRPSGGTHPRPVPHAGTGTRAGAHAGADPAPPSVCNNARLLAGPSTPPAGAVTVSTGVDDPSQLGAPHTTYWFAPGVHTLGGGKFTQIIPGDGDTYIGAPGAVLSGAGVNAFAFTQRASGVTIEYLTIKDFGAPGAFGTQGVVNHTSGTGWTIEHDTIEHNGDAGVMLGSGNVLEDNCLSDNGQYGFSVYSTTGAVSNVTVSDNEVAGNATFDWTAERPGCGCSGGAKFWNTRGAVVTGNSFHDNHNVGLWVDTDNAGFEIADNYIAHNAAEGIMYEISYNAVITRNTLIDNGWKAGPTIGFPEPAIYISESGADRRVPGPYSGRFTITHNVLIDNWSGVVLWENANRFCGDGSDGVCTLVEPGVYTRSSCPANLPAAEPGQRPDYFDNCRWRTMGVNVSRNTFSFSPKAIGPACTATANCGYTGLFSEFGSVAPYKGWVVPNAISNFQHDVFSRNTYRGPWRFDGFALGIHLTWAQWTHGVPDAGSSGDRFRPQDAHSTYHP